MRRGRKGGRPEVAREGSEGALRAGCACRRPRPWEVCAFPALGVWDNFVQPFVVFPPMRLESGCFQNKNVFQRLLLL